MNRTQRAIGEALIIATVLTAALALAQVFATTTPLNAFETAAVWFSFGSTWLCTRQVRFNYVFAVAATSLLVYTFWQADLYGSMALNLYLIPTVIYGWFVWGRDTKTRPVEHVRPRNLALYAFFTAATWLGAYFLITALGGEMVALDGWLLVGTVLAQFLMDRKKLENWLVWAAVNVVSIYVYFETGLPLLAAQFALFLANSIYAWFQWRKTMGAAVEAPPVEVQPAIVLAK